MATCRICGYNNRWTQRAKNWVDENMCKTCYVVLKGKIFTHIVRSPFSVISDALQYVYKNSPLLHSDLTKRMGRGGLPTGQLIRFLLVKKFIETATKRAGVGERSASPYTMRDSFVLTRKGRSFLEKTIVIQKEFEIPDDIMKDYFKVMQA